MNRRIVFFTLITILAAGCDANQPRSQNSSSASSAALTDNAVAPTRLDTSLKYLVMAEDAQLESVGRNEQLSQKVLAGLAAGLAEQGLQIYDEEIITLENYVQGRSRRDNEELIDIASSIRNPLINRVVFVSVEKQVRRGTAFDRAGVRFSARVLDVQSGRQIGASEYIPAPFRLPNGCIENQSCIRDALHQNPQKWGREFANKVIQDALL